MRVASPTSDACPFRLLASMNCGQGSSLLPFQAFLGQCEGNVFEVGVEEMDGCLFGLWD